MASINTDEIPIRLREDTTVPESILYSTSREEHSLNRRESITTLPLESTTQISPKHEVLKSSDTSSNPLFTNKISGSNISNSSNCESPCSSNSSSNFVKSPLLIPESSSVTALIVISWDASLSPKEM